MPSPLNNPECYILTRVVLEAKKRNVGVEDPWVIAGTAHDLLRQALEGVSRILPGPDIMTLRDVDQVSIRNRLMVDHYSLRRVQLRNNIDYEGYSMRKELMEYLAENLPQFAASQVHHGPPTTYHSWGNYEGQASSQSTQPPTDGIHNLDQSSSQLYPPQPTINYAQSSNLDDYAQSSNLDDYAQSSNLDDYAQSSNLDDYAQSSNLDEQSTYTTPSMSQSQPSGQWPAGYSLTQASSQYYDDSIDYVQDEPMDYVEDDTMNNADGGWGPWPPQEGT